MFSPSDAARHTFGRSKATVAEVIDRRREESRASVAAVTTRVRTLKWFLGRLYHVAKPVKHPNKPNGAIAGLDVLNVCHSPSTGSPNPLSAGTREDTDTGEDARRGGTGETISCLLNYLYLYKMTSHTSCSNDVEPTTPPLRSYRQTHRTHAKPHGKS